MLTLVVFVLFLAIFGGVCLWAFIDNRLPPDSVSSAASGEDASPFTAADVRWLFVAAQDGTEPRGFVAVRADPENGRIHAVAVPRETEVADGTTLIRLWGETPPLKTSCRAAPGIGKFEKAGMGSPFSRKAKRSALCVSWNCAVSPSFNRDCPAGSDGVLTGSFFLFFS